MATLQLGKLKFRFKDGGVDYRWGDGEIKRIGKKSEQGMADDYAGQYDDYDEDESLNYGGRFADEDDYPDDGYVDDGFFDGDYAEDDYPEDNYAGAGYDYGGYDDGYDDGYDEEGYDDYDPEYDDRYSDEDADDGYGEEDYEPYDDSYDGGYIDGEQENGFLQYVDENDWVTYLLLVLLPPLGVYLLWRRQRFEPVIRYSVMAASAVWFVVMIILLITLLTSGHQEITGEPQLPTLQPKVEVTETPVPSVSPSPSANTGISALTAPSATPISGGSTATLAQGSVVWAAASGNFYHRDQNCELAVGQTLAQTTIENAKNRSKYACPECYGGDIYYATAGGDYYHLDKTCTRMVDAEMYSIEKAKAEGKEACPVCVTKTRKTLNTTVENENLTFVTSSTKDKSGVKVWCTSGGDNYHMTSSCRGMKGAKQVSLSEALLMGKTACSTCCEVSGEMVYCTKGGTYYHRNSTCSGMKKASQVTIAEAMVLGKKECPTCRPVANNSSSSSSSASSGASSGSSSSSSNSSTEEYYVYATKGGTYYHVKKNCTGMTGASKVTLKSMIDEGRPACPECCGGAGMSVYASKGGTYYHSYATCTGMTNARAGTLSAALAAGYKRCPRCWGESGSTTSGSSSSGNSAATATSDTVKVYATTNGKHYHTKPNCTGMKNARYITLTQAMNEGKTACSTCAATASKTVYSTSGGKYYHKASTCDHMDNGVKRTLADALKMGQTACPVCMTTGSDSADNSENTSTPDKVANFTVGTSGIKVYASPSHTYYHTKSSCSKAASGLSQVALETALNYGRKACPTCCASASESVYATKNGKYYHVSKSCAGSGASKGALASALAYGFSPCPYCVSGKFDEDGGSGTYESGRSGIKVYATSSDKYYHTKQSCADSGAVKVTLETALNYGKKACQECCAIADRTVYAVKDSFYYHASKDCAGDDAVTGTYAKALAFGLKACPNCIGGSSDSGSSDDAPEYSDAADSSVYIDLYGDSFYYHKASKCSGSGVSGATEVTLEYAKDFGYERCPHCNPASDVA